MEEHWNAFRSHKRSATVHQPFSIWMVKALQIIKLLIFLAAHALLVFGAVLSKLIAIVLVTNIQPNQQYIFHGPQTKFDKRCSTRAESSEIVRAACLMAIFAIHAIPDIFALVQSVLRISCGRRSSGQVRFTLIFFECCRSTGVYIVYMMVLPKVDVLRCVCLLAAIQMVPMAQSLIAQMSRSFHPSFPLIQRLGLLLGSLPHFLLTLTLFSACYLWLAFHTPVDTTFSLPLGLLLFSIGFWESWINPAHAGSYFHHLYQIKYGIRKVNPPTRLVISILRVSIGLLVVLQAAKGVASPQIFRKLLTSYSMDFTHTNILLMAGAACFLHFLLRSTVQFVAAMSLRIPAALHPISLTLPLTLACSYVMCNYLPICGVAKHLANMGLTYHCRSWSSDKRTTSDTYFCVAWMLVSLYRSYLLARSPDFDKSDEVIDSIPSISNGLCIEQSLIVFQHSLLKTESRVDEDNLELDEKDLADELRIRCDEIDKVSTLYVCATMWHETKTEMTQMFKSILKLDEERASSESKKRKDGIQFRLEVHIFFDDAWEDQAESGRVPNQFFQTFFHLINEFTQEAADELHSMPTRMLVSTSYGGRLVVRLPAGTLLFVHLKDKKLIRHKKRWSQVMYMYYLLGHRIMDSHMSIEDRQLTADNTYILAIDGDSKFEPEAVMRLLHLMNMKSDIGCACGRIHPIGNGVMVWYQKFEYSIAHWFQKAAEHVFGCVLCAPGCFSLFRASALMDDNIMHKYTKTAEEPRHFVQYDQGEDRWLSTLMLKQGYRIEYAAASDAETYAPEGFEEFFNQRRRWTPSSVANTIDLLADYKRAVANNESISMLYILYQFIVIGFSMLGPGIIFSMLVFAQVAAFGVDSSTMMIYNATPIILFIVFCFTTESNVQLFYAKILSIIYAFIMLAVLVATTSQIIMESILAPTSMFIVGMVIIFSAAAILHPQECSNILHGTVFFLLIPSTYVFLSLYSLINLNVINWGTREAVAKATGKVEQTSTVEKLLRRLASGPLGGLFPSLRPRSDPTIEMLERRIERLDRTLRELKKDDTKTKADPFDRLRALAGGADGTGNETSELQDVRRTEGKDDMDVRGGNKCLWMDAEYLQVCERGRLKASEERFWDQLIDTYLKPIESSAAEQKEVAEGLVSLRNNIAFAIILLNGLLVLAIFLIQRNKDILSFTWRLDGKMRQMKVNPKTGRYEATDDPLLVDPLGMAIIVFLLGILIVQTVGMLIHRLNTLLGAFQELDSMQENCENSSLKRDDDEALLEAARSMVDTSSYANVHGADGFTRLTGDAKNVLYKLQQARLVQRLQAGGSLPSEK